MSTNWDARKAIQILNIEQTMKTAAILMYILYATLALLYFHTKGISA